ncbi:MAG: acetolactate synthase small subunit, partial [Oscillospiraceae bacterium]
MSAQKEVISILVHNHSGVLARVSSLFGRRGYNIDSLTVSATNDPAISRITIMVEGDKQVIDQILNQTSKLIETISVSALSSEDSIQRELLLVKVAADDASRAFIKDAADVYKASIVDLSTQSVVIELTGKPSKIDAFITLVSEYNILEMCRTGVTALE